MKEFGRKNKAKAAKVGTMTPTKDQELVKKLLSQGVDLAEIMKAYLDFAEEYRGSKREALEAFVAYVEVFGFPSNPEAKK